MKVKDMKINKHNFNIMNERYGQAVSVQTGVMWDLIHRKV